jgi:hypothetical protein
MSRLLPTFAIIPITIIIACLLLASSANNSYAAAFNLKINQRVFIPNDTLIVYGTGSSGDSLLVSLIDPAGRTIRIDSISIDDAGSFFKEFFIWPQPTKNFVFGQYTVRVASSANTSNSQEILITYAEGISQSLNTAESHTLIAKLDSPTQVATNSTFRIFIQVTYDGALVNSELPEFLGSSHIHYGNQTINLANKFVKLHEGIYYADVVLPQDGSYIVHAIAYYKGYESHDSKVVSASNASIGTVQESVNSLNNKLESANQELAQLQVKLNQTDSTLQSAESTIKGAVQDARSEISNNIDSAKGSVEQIAQASGQINAIFLPILALISVIIALQISLFARIRASYR